MHSNHMWVEGQRPTGNYYCAECIVTYLLLHSSLIHGSESSMSYFLHHAALAQSQGKNVVYKITAMPVWICVA